MKIFQSHTASGAKAALAAFARDKRGAVAMLFAIILLPALLMAGAVIDYGRALKQRARNQDAADASVLAAVSVAVKYMNDNASAANVQQKAIAAATSFANSLYAANSGNADGFALTMSYTPGQFTAQATATSIYQTSFMTLGGINTISLGSRSQATSRTPLYKTMHLLLDISQSMGLAATNADMINLWNKTKQETGKGCTFGCHVTLVNGKDSNSVIAAKNNITLRIDSLRSAVRNLFVNAKNSGHANYYNFSVYTTDATLKQLTGPINNYSTLDQIASALDLGPTNQSGPAASYQPEALTGITSAIPAAGSGVSPSSALQYLVLVTDGVYDKQGACTSGHCTGPIDPALCSSAKQKGVNVAVIYTTYLPIYKDPANSGSGYDDDYKSLVLPFASQIKPKMQACASPNMFFEASDGPAIDNAFRSIFALTAATSLTR